MKGHMAKTDARASVGHELPARQRGLIALVTAITLLLVVTGVTLFVSRIVLLEQRLSANEVRARQAFEAADAGINYALGYLGMTGGVDHDRDGRFDQGFEPADAPYEITLGDAGHYAVDGVVTITSVGESEDGDGYHTIEQQVRIAPPLGAPVTHPLIVRGPVRFSGNPAIINTEGNATIWAGGEVSIWGSGGAFIADGTLDGKGHPNTVQSSGKFGTGTRVGVDVIDNSPPLASVTGDAFFSHFFSGDRGFVKRSATYRTASRNLLAPSGGAGIDGSMIWVDAGAAGFQLASGRYGSAAAPIILVIDGDLRLGASPTIHGVVYVAGDLVGGGGRFELVGALMVEGKLEMEGNGRFSVTYDSDIIDRANSLNRTVARLPGTWKDW